MTRLTRRRFVARLAGLAGLVAAGVRCGPSSPTPEEIAARAGSFDPGLDCTSTIGLFPAEVQTRTENEYRDRSDRETEYCFACQNYVPPEQVGACAGCTTVKGPINPLGWCTAFTLAREL